MKYFARTTVGSFQRQPLYEHLKNVAVLTQTFAQAAYPDDALFVKSAYLAGLLHDLGKYRIEFQELLAGKRARIRRVPTRFMCGGRMYAI
jgi:HD superfamily phosphohydrolase YqeK